MNYFNSTSESCNASELTQGMIFERSAHGGSDSLEGNIVESEAAAQIETPDDPRHQLNQQALKYLGMVMRWCRIPGKHEEFYFVSEVFQHAERDTRLLIDKSDGRWEYEAIENEGDESKASRLPYGWDMVSLVSQLLQQPLDDASRKLEVFLTALDSDNEIEDVLEIELNNSPAVACVVPVPANAPTPPDTLSNADYPLWSASGQLLGYTRLYYEWTRLRSSGIGQVIALPLTYCSLQDGSQGWKTRYLPRPYPLFGLEKLALNPGSPVILCEDEQSADYCQDMFCPSIPRSLTVGLISAPGTLDETDLRPIGGRVVYILTRSIQTSEKLKARLEAINPRTWIAIIQRHLVPPPPRQDKASTSASVALPSDADAWGIVEGLRWASENRAPLRFSIPTPSRKNAVVQVDDFLVKDDGVFVEKIRDGEPHLVRIASRIDVTAKARSAGESHRWGICLEFDDSDGVTHQWCVPATYLGGDASAFTKPLLDMGAYVSPQSSHRQELARYFLSAEPASRARSVSRPGWDRDMFVFPDGSAVGHSNERVAYETTDPNSHGFREHGNLADWKRQVASLCQGNSRLVLAVCTALTGPVLSLLGEENGGFHFTGDSSCGKTTTLFPACSVWGQPERVINTWRATDNGIEARATLHNDMIYALDEMSQVSPEHAGQIVYMLANGQGKVRSRQDSNAQTIKQWRLMFLSTGEVGLEQHVEGGGGHVMAGQQARLIDVPADAGVGMGIFENIYGCRDGAEFSLHLKNQASQFYGSAGRAWVHALSDPKKKATILESIRAQVQRFADAAIPLEASGQVKRVGRRFGLIAAVGEVCIEQGILPWALGEAHHQVRRCFQQWVENRGGAGNLEDDQAPRQLRRFLEMYGESRFTEIGLDEDTVSNENRVTIGRVGFRKTARDGHTDYYILPEAYKSEVCQGMDYRRFTQKLMEANMLVLASDRKPQVTKRLPGLRSARVYHVRSTVLGMSENS